MGSTIHHTPSPPRPHLLLQACLEDGDLDPRRQQLFPHLLVTEQDLPEFVPDLGDGQEGTVLCDIRAGSVSGREPIRGRCSTY